MYTLCPFVTVVTMFWRGQGRLRKQTGYTLPLLRSFPGVHTLLAVVLCVSISGKQLAVVVQRSKKIGRPSANSTRSVITHLHTIAPTSFFNTVDVCSLTVQSATSSVSISDLVCQLCSSIVDRPIQLTTCNRLVCLNCLCSSLSENGFSCPCCRDDHLRDHNTMVCPSPVVMKIIGDLLVPCDKCNKQVVTGIQKYTPLNLIIILLSNPVLSYSKLPATCGQQLHGKPGKWVFSNHHHPGGSCKVSRLPSDASGDEAHC